MFVSISECFIFFIQFADENGPVLDSVNEDEAGGELI